MIKDPVILHKALVYSEQIGIRAVLDNNGVEYEMRDENAALYNVEMSAAGGGMKIIIDQSDFENALSLMVESGFMTEEEKRLNLLPPKNPLISVQNGGQIKKWTIFISILLVVLAVLAYRASH